MSMQLSFTSRKRIRKNFGKITHVSSMPNLIEVQKKSYDHFLQSGVKVADRKKFGLQEVFSFVFPIEDAAGNASLEFVHYTLGEPTLRGGNYSISLKVTLRLIVWDLDEDTGSKEIKGIKEQEVYFGEIPYMTDKGTFIVNGTERVIVSQMHRSPGVFFDHDKGKTHSSGKYLYSARVIPYRGSWLDFEFDAKDVIYFRIDRKRKLYATTLLRALGMSTNEILSTYYDRWTYKKDKKGWRTKFLPETIKGYKLKHPLVDASTGKVVAEAGTKMTPRLGKKLIDSGVTDCLISSEELIGKFVAENLIDSSTGEILIPAGEEILKEHISQIEIFENAEIYILAIDHINCGGYIRNTIVSDKNLTKEEALIDIYRVIRPGEPPTYEAAQSLFDSLYFNKDRYDISEVGRVKLNARLGLDLDLETTILSKDDIIKIVHMLCQLRDGQGEIDDIDHLGNRRVRSVGELIENQFRVGMVRVERAILERLSAVEIDTVMPHDLVNSKLLITAIRDFFTSSQLSQFMDQTNPLSEITHKRRLSALGPGGLTRERASFEVRDVHPTHYGRICPIETPEGQNIGLINSLSTYAKVNKHGFIESPYRKVINAKVTDDVVYLSAIDEAGYVIAQANAEIDDHGELISDLVSCRLNGEFIMSEPKKIDYIDVSPMQLVSVAASLIPFLENDDANRALMGSNMQRQAVPLLRSEAPFVGTGIEEVVARDSGATVVAKCTGVVEQVDSRRIVVRTIGEDDADSIGVEIYNLQKYQRSNHNTCINQIPLVKVGDVVKKDDIMADGPSTELGELALGRNLLVAFMPWNGYNFEDSILISEKLVSEDILTSIHIEEFEVVARDTRLGPEEITRDIPNIGEESLRHVDEVGIVHVGAEVRPGDILIGKVTPKSESPMTPEEKLLRAIFGEKASDVRDSSLHVPPGVQGTVVDVQILTRRGVEKDQRALAIEREHINRFEKDKQDQLLIIEGVMYSKLIAILNGQTVTSGPKGLKAGTVITEEILQDFTKGQWWQIEVKDNLIMEEISKMKEKLDLAKATLEKKFLSQVESVKSGDDLPQGALKVIKVFIAMKHKLQPGDKMAGRHGNKGVISRILPMEDMPYLDDGSPVDIVLNPLGVPSRMNVGQILETHLGWASVKLGQKIGQMLDEYNKQRETIDDLKKYLKEVYEDKRFDKAVKDFSDQEILELTKNISKGVPYSTPVFDGAKEDAINKMLVKAGACSSGQVRLIDGRTGEHFDRKATVGYIYMLKLHHLVDDKIHARSIGPYSLVTQQPLGGKSHFGGQRVGEMECWALQAYGAAYTLQEMLTVKSDDVTGRIKMYESIVRGDQNFESGIPESFNVMIKELRSLCLNIELVKN